MHDRIPVSELIKWPAVGIHEEVMGQSDRRIFVLISFGLRHFANTKPERVKESRDEKRKCANGSDISGNRIIYGLR